MSTYLLDNLKVLLTVFFNFSKNEIKSEFFLFSLTECITIVLEDIDLDLTNNYHDLVSGYNTFEEMIFFFIQTFYEISKQDELLNDLYYRFILIRGR